MCFALVVEESGGDASAVVDVVKDGYTVVARGVSVRDGYAVLVAVSVREGYAVVVLVEAGTSSEA